MRPLTAPGSGARLVVRLLVAAVMSTGWSSARAQDLAGENPAQVEFIGSTAPKVEVVGASPAVFLTRPGPQAGVVQSGCTTCGLPPIAPLTGLGAHDLGDPGCGGCGGCGEGGCVPGRPACETCEGHDPFSRLFCGFRNALCCPDPCYEPGWVAAANAALFVPSVRPNTYTRFRWDYGSNVTTPDRAEYFWKAPGSGGPNATVNGNRVSANRVNYHELSIYTEFGTDKFSFFIDTPYRSLRADLTGGAGSFGDLTVGTKSVLTDSELMLLSFQFKTIIPTGNQGRGTGTGHVSLDPSLLWALKLAPNTYWQGQLGYWIPIGATPKYSGGVVEYNNSLNCVLWRPVRDTALIGTLESTGYTFTSGRFTDAAGVQRSAQATYFNLGPGLRLSVCDKFEAAFGIQFALTRDHFANQLYRTEIRWRF